ncbi:MAG: phosphate signaling complex protein PhoU [Desulfococcaceae bacterium]|jgi:phosphate transport system protein|nr:phosphate signaling complex protein PhoU [Desulfococcaceae bacterium]
MSKHLDRELDKIKKRVLALGAKVEERLQQTVKAVETQSLYDAERIIRTDYEIDQEEVEIEEECLKILALHQPVAIDLRFLIITVKINNDLERIADETSNIARRVKRAIQKKNGCNMVYDYSEMLEKCQSMLKNSLDSLIRMDVDTAFKVLITDDEIDQIDRIMYQKMVDDIKIKPECNEYLINIYWMSRHLERIADHATNIAEEVIYLIEGEIVRHRSY